MQNPIRFSRAVALGLTLAVLGTGANASVLIARATLATPLPAPRDADVEGIHWHCDGAACVGTVEYANSRRPTAMNACHTLAETMGAVTAFQRTGIDMSAGNIEHCNARAVMASAR